ncbi:ABC transporter permease [Crateriforma conspicua]|uniref:Macrolide export ATP-binding/permease protein MacB n=1 Tax=Crateriforma conspicua TaxID=2527996 RepID=A0A5C5Y1P5_9PLAN|nr:FtsX-like permease family protein [Crateriforma conspicua]QDV62679.1 Macrolide export ATP-binding/permease protein MacB [Crateriforma conspicua]TWT68551.1 Macrolide export ATP-binding/permease protein MacB [Crateriforma conspicua]
MNLRKLVWRELFERKSQMITIFVGILLGITTVIAIKNITYYSEMAVAREMDSLGANVLVLPKSVTLQDYYSADLHNETIPEEYALRLTMSNLAGVDNLSPKLCVPVELQSRSFTLTGILPKSEFQAKAAWGGAGIFSRPIGCGAIDVGTSNEPEDKKTLVRKRVIDDLATDEALVGSDTASVLGISEGQTLELLGQQFSVVAVLPETGTVDDSRIFAHLHTVQEMSGKDAVVSCIEIVGCCKEISAGLVGKVNDLLPDAKVVTVAQVVATQAKVNGMMEKLSLIFVAIIIVIGGAGIANFMFANVYERRREIGTLMSLGAQSGLILRIFLLKALLLGVAGGVSGFVIGTTLAVTLGPRLANVPVLPMPILALWAIGISVGTTLLASYFPARNAARLDPVTSFKEV